MKVSVDDFDILIYFIAALGQITKLKWIRPKAYKKFMKGLIQVLLLSYMW